MDKKKKDEVLNALTDFVIRVAKGKATSEAEVKALPEVAKIVVDYLSTGLAVVDCSVF